MRIEPTTHLLASVRRRAFSYHDAFAELIDNSIDAGARRIFCWIKNAEAGIQDDGRGVNAEAVRAMLTPGEHGAGNDSGLGIYGIGFNLAALWLADETTIIGIRRGEYVRAFVAWPSLEKSGHWEVSDPTCRPATPEDFSATKIDPRGGTRVVFGKLIHKLLYGKNFDDFAQKIRFMFTPALREGRQIILRSPRNVETILTPQEFPACSHMTTKSLLVAGRQVDVRCGVVESGAENRFRGFAVAFRHRYIERSSEFCRDYPAARVAGEIILGREWHADLSDSKNALTKHYEELVEAVHEACKDIFKLAETQTQTLQLSHLSKRAAAMLATGEDPPTEKARRGRGGNASGTVLPTGNGSPHRRAARTQRGDRFRKYRPDGVKIEFADIEGDAIGEADSRALRVTLNTNHRVITKIVKEDNAAATAILVASLLAYDHLNHPDGTQRAFSFNTEKFEILMGIALRKVAPDDDEK